MLNRKLEVKMVKSNKNEAITPNQTETIFEGKAAIIGYYFEKIITKAGKAALAYVVLDTIRQVVVAQTQPK